MKHWTGRVSGHCVRNTQPFLHDGDDEGSIRPHERPNGEHLRVQKTPRLSGSVLRVRRDHADTLEPIARAGPVGWRVPSQLLDGNLCSGNDKK